LDLLGIAQKWNDGYGHAGIPHFRNTAGNRYQYPMLNTLSKAHARAKIGMVRFKHRNESSKIETLSPTEKIMMLSIPNWQNHDTICRITRACRQHI
jgi:hypothetical protein